MCGRLVLTSNYRARIKDIFANVEASGWQPPRYNLAPSQLVPAMLDLDPKRIEWITWGFPPAQPKQAPLINARSETVHELPTFRPSFESRRCIVLADGFYEWKRDPALASPQPYFFQLKGGRAIPLAGIRDKNDGRSCVLLTTEANTLMQPIHDRMPVIFTPSSAHIWLSRETPLATLRALLQPFPSAEMISYPVSRLVNRTANEGEDLIKPVQIFEQESLF